MFEVAARKKYRYPYRGMISTEDLWDLDVTALDSIFKTLNAKVKASSEESLLKTQSAEDRDLVTQIEIVKHVVAVKLQEAEARKNERANREQKQKILGIIAEKNDEKLKGMSVEQLQKLVESM